MLEQILPLVIAAILASIASTPGNELWIPAAGLTDGASGASGVTDLYRSNLGGDAVIVNLMWPQRGGDNSIAEDVPLSIDGGETIPMNSGATITAAGNAVAHVLGIRWNDGFAGRSFAACFGTAGMIRSDF